MGAGNSVIYETKGAAKEYSPLGVNLYKGCKFACKYCYAPSIALMTMADWSRDPQEKKDILERLEKDARRMAGDERSILLCFTCDPYQSDKAAALTRKALLILEKYDLTATVLTKGGMRAVADFDILKRNNWKFGTTLSFLDCRVKQEWEPNAASAGNRIRAITTAHNQGIETWVSVEPVMSAYEAMNLIGGIHPAVDFWKIGKMNHRKLDIDWVKFREDAVKLLDSLGAKYYIKKELGDCK